MARYHYNLLELDEEKLFTDHKIEEIIEIGKLLDAEIERKRVDLRSMVGDRYKDVLTASDAIKNMKTISQKIVGNIETITNACESLALNKEEKHNIALSETEFEKSKEERELIIQIRLAIFMNEKIWSELDTGDNLTAAQYYLLAQHIHMGLSLAKKEYLVKLPLLKQIREGFHDLKQQIFHKIKQKLESEDISAEECGNNLNALLLLRNQTPNDLLSIFIEYRKATLNFVINSSHASVRIQISEMVKCLINTITLLHDCFLSYGDSKNGLIWQQFQTITEPTVSKLQLPASPLINYLPDLVKEFIPKYKSDIQEPKKGDVKLDEWLQSTKLSIQNGLTESLDLISSIKGLHIIREEALKISVPNNWDQICSESSLPDNFNVWSYFFQNLITERARVLISKKISVILNDLQTDINRTFTTDLNSIKSESDLRWYTWQECFDDISKIENKHTELSMKTLGYSAKIVDLCNKFDKKFLELLLDISQYLYGKEYEDKLIILTHLKSRKKFIDRDALENHLRIESTKNFKTLTTFLHNLVKMELNSSLLVAKALICARFLQAVTVLCPHFKKCCSFNDVTDDWTRLCATFLKDSLQFWKIWLEKCVKETESKIKRDVSYVSVCSTISTLLRWDIIEIQEQTNEQTFKSQIKVPLKPTLLLIEILNKLNDDLSYVLPHTIPKQVHIEFIERNVECILDSYKLISKSEKLHQNQCLQYLFDVKFLSTFCISRENSSLVALSQEICDILRSQIDPFDLDVFYDYLQGNVKRAVLQSQAIFGCLLPSSAQLANFGVGEKSKDQEKDPSLVALSVPSVAFPLFCTFVHQVPTQNSTTPTSELSKASVSRSAKSTPKKSQDPTAAIRSSAAALFGNLKTDWFS